MNNHFKSGDVAELRVGLNVGIPRGAVVHVIDLIPAGTAIVKDGALSFWEHDGWIVKWGGKKYRIYEHLLRYASQAIKKNRGVGL